jgi:hypothetical protein
LSIFWYCDDLLVDEFIVTLSGDGLEYLFEVLLYVEDDHLGITGRLDHLDYCCSVLPNHMGIDHLVDGGVELGYSTYASLLLGLVPLHYIDIILELLLESRHLL